MWLATNLFGIHAQTCYTVCDLDRVSRGIGSQKQPTIAASLRAHVNTRVDALYPATVYTDEEGALLPQFQAMVEEQSTRHAWEPTLF